MAEPAYRLPPRLRRREGAFVIQDADGKNLAYVYFEEIAERRSMQHETRHGGSACGLIIPLIRAPGNPDNVV